MTAAPDFAPLFPAERLPPANPEADAARLVAVPISQRDAFALVRSWHRHHRPPRGDILRVAAVRAGEFCGVAIVGRPVARMLQDGMTCELLRLATDGSPNVCSFLTGRIVRAAIAIGYRRVITYTLPSEGGGAMRAAGWKLIGEAGGGSWSRESRQRADDHPTEPKMRWEKAA